MLLSALNRLFANIQTLRGRWGPDKFDHFSGSRLITMQSLCYIQELLHIHETIFWVDSSIRMQTSDLKQIYQQAANRSSPGLVMFDVSGHNIFMATHALMYRYLPITKDSAVNVSMHGACAIFIRRSKQVGNAVFVSRPNLSPMYSVSTQLTRRICCHPQVRPGNTFVCVCVSVCTDLGLSFALLALLVISLFTT